MPSIVLSRRAVKDLRRIGPGDELDRIRLALEAIGAGGPGPDVKPLRGQTPWHRLRVGDHRILYRPISPEESSEDSHLVARIVHGRDLERAVSTLA